jgi:hypothetical protein
MLDIVQIVYPLKHYAEKEKNNYSKPRSNQLTKVYDRYNISPVVEKQSQNSPLNQSPFSHISWMEEMSKISNFFSANARN